MYIGFFFIDNMIAEINLYRSFISEEYINGIEKNTNKFIDKNRDDYIKLEKNLEEKNIFFEEYMQDEFIEKYQRIQGTKLRFIGIHIVELYSLFEQQILKFKEYYNPQKTNIYEILCEFEKENLCTTIQREKLLEWGRIANIAKHGKDGKSGKKLINKNFIENIREKTDIEDGVVSYDVIDVKWEDFYDFADCLTDFWKGVKVNYKYIKKLVIF